MQSEFLSPQELVELTGRRRPTFQIERLKLVGLPYFVDADGKPVVSRYEVKRASNRKAGVKNGY